MLLLDVPNISALRLGVEGYSKVFLSFAFISALTWEFFGDMKFMGVVKNLVLSLVFMGCFYQFHTKAVDISFKASEELLREVSPRNIFLKKWNEVKVKSMENSNGSFVDKLIVPNINDLLGTALFLLSKVCILILKLIYTTVYYFTFIFAPVTAVLSFIPNSKNSMAGTITSSLWCILLPFVLVVFMALVGNTVQIPSEHGQLAVSSMDHLIWIFGITLLMLLTPSFTYSLIKGSVASTADAIGVKMTGVGAKALVSLPVMYGLGQKFFGKGKKGNKNNFRKPYIPNQNSRSQFTGLRSNQNRVDNTYRNSLKENGGVNLKHTDQSTGKLSEIKQSQTISKQNSPAMLASNLPNLVNAKNNSISAKIPFGPSSLEMEQIRQPREQIFKINPNSKFVPKTIHASANPTGNAVRQDRQVNQVQPTRPSEPKPILERTRSKDFKTVIPKERQREV